MYCALCRQAHFDVPAFAKIMGEELIERLLTQIEPYKPAFEFDQLVIDVSASENGIQLKTVSGTSFSSKCR